MEPLDFACRRLDVSVVAQRHCDVARNSQKILQDHESLQDHVVILGVDELSEKDKLAGARDCKVKQFVSHPFFVAEMFTRTPEKSVDLETTFSEFDKVLSGNCEKTPETAPKKVGKLVNVRTLSLRQLIL